LSNFIPLGAVKDINIFEKLFDLFKAHIERQLLVALPYQGSNINFLPWRSLHPIIHGVSEKTVQNSFCQSFVNFL